MSSYHLFAANGGVRKIYYNVNKVEITEPSTLRLYGASDAKLPTSMELLSIIQLAPGERLERAELHTDLAMRPSVQGVRGGAGGGM